MAEPPGNLEENAPGTTPPADGGAPASKPPESVGSGGGATGPVSASGDAAPSAGHSARASEQVRARAAAETSRAAVAADRGSADETEHDEAAMPVGSVALDLPDFGGGRLAGSEAESITLLNDVKLDVKIELGRANMRIEEVLQLGEGSVVELDKLAGDPVDVLVNERLVARGEVLVLNDNFCVRISEVLAGEETEGGAR